MTPFLELLAWTVPSLLVLAGVLHLVPRLGSGGRALSDLCCRAPLLDLIVTAFTVAPYVLGAIVGGWQGVGGAVVGQVLTLILWTILHELAHPQARKGPRIVRLLNGKVGTVRNLVAVFWTAIVTPGFFFVRVCEVFVYPPLTWLVRLPPYRHGDWVNVSRHKFSGLVGHDLIWCLYCDWMTGVWSLGTEMLRNVESFWCPIRFYDGKKCENCKVDFPDIDNGWVPASATMSDVVALLNEKYPDGAKHHPWFGHPVRITVGGKQVDRQT